MQTINKKAQTVNKESDAIRIATPVQEMSSEMSPQFLLDVVQTETN